MSAGNFDITIDQGSDFTLTLVIKDGNTPRNLTGYSARGHLRASYDTAQYWAFDFSSTTFDSNGTLIMKMAHNVVADNGNTALSEGNYVYDVELFKQTDGSDTEVERIIQGKAKVSREVTR